MDSTSFAQQRKTDFTTLYCTKAFFLTVQSTKDEKVLLEVSNPN